MLLQQIGVLLLFGLIGAILYLSINKLLKAAWRLINVKSKKS